MSFCNQGSHLWLEQPICYCSLYIIYMLGYFNSQNNFNRQWIDHSFVIVHMESGQWQASFTRERLACLMEVIVMEQILHKFSRNAGGTKHVQIVCTRVALFFSPPTHKSLGVSSKRLQPKICSPWLDLHTCTHTHTHKKDSFHRACLSILSILLISCSWSASQRCVICV